MATIAEIEKVRADRKAGLAKQRDEQRAKDLAALNEIEEQRGDGMVQRVEVKRYLPGLPTLVVVSMPDPVTHKRYRDRLAAGTAISEAREELVDVKAAVAYPDPDTYKTLRDKLPGFHQVVALTAVLMAEGQALEEGKG